MNAESQSGIQKVQYEIMVITTTFFNADLKSTLKTYTSYMQLNIVYTSLLLWFI